MPVVIRRRAVPEPATVDPIAERRAFDLQELSRPRFVAVAHRERPANQAGFELAHATGRC
jgi:hypothetical protein